MSRGFVDYITILLYPIMKYKLYDYVSKSGRNEFKKWSQKLDTLQLAKLNEKLDDLEDKGTLLDKQILSESGEPHIKKLRFQGKVAMRPLLCEGPTRDDNNQYNREFTLLCGAIEKDRKLPKNILKIAKKRREELEKNHKKRRCEHESVNPKTKKQFQK